MSSGTFFKDCIIEAEILLDSSEIEHLIEVLREDTKLLHGDYLDESDKTRMARFGPAAMVAERLRQAIRNCFWATEHEPMDTLDTIQVVADRYCRFSHAECLTDALRLAYMASTQGLCNEEFWRLRARLEQITSTALFGVSGAPSASELNKAKEIGAAERNTEVARSGGKMRAEKLFGHFKKEALKSLAERAYDLAGRRLKKAAVARAILKNDLEKMAEALKQQNADLNKALPTLATIEKWIDAPYKKLPMNHAPAKQTPDACPADKYFR
ncbi:hypothetical protein NJC38_25410 [Pseudomonas sp. 21LCFQ010]|uniref:hypothetical protein n=1 Tax=Pseudomonas sp. 21LCFQ010 TaxID=2957506 RepID=UPI0020979420|nr:hypothetical protein [Pseudomonas sp. 21LCFQ010]MCO8165479.1 hypothetical protein [Pseudomonas sp. 21LCFQ010]